MEFCRWHDWAPPDQAITDSLRNQHSSPLPEQRAIADILRTLDRKIQAEEARKAALDALFRTLLHHLMTGKVWVRGALTESEE